MEAASSYPQFSGSAPTQHMTRVTNPFALTLIPSRSSVKDGLSCTFTGTEPSTLLLCWGINIKEAFNTVYLPWDNFLSMFKDAHAAKEYLSIFASEVSIKQYSSCTEEEIHLQPERSLDLGPVPRDRYPLAVYLISGGLQDDDALMRMRDHVVCQVMFIHLNDDVCSASSHVVGNFVRTPFSQSCNIQALYPSEEQTSAQYTTLDDANKSTELGNEQPNSNSNGESGRHKESETPRDTRHTECSTEQVEASQNNQSYQLRVTCVICQMHFVDRVILPCKHLCVCESCFTRIDQCPVCRGMILSTFRLHGQLDASEYGVENTVTCDSRVEQHGPWWERMNDRINALFGFE